MTLVGTLLLISSDLDLCNTIKKLANPRKFDSVCVSEIEDAVTLLRHGMSVDLLIFDQPKRSPAILLDWVSRDRICVVSGTTDSFPTEDAASLGIGHVFIKPVFPGDLTGLYTSAGFTTKVSISNQPQSTTCLRQHRFEELDNNRFFFAASPSMLRIYDEVILLAPVNIPVLILGESGVGKEIVAMLLHKHHALAERTFLNVNCAALPTELLESELFGYEAGAFTGAMKSKPGKFELANKGTILLDEIGEMSPQMQAKLLHVLQDGTFSRLGSRSPTKVDVRVLAATNIDLQGAIADKRFREDLYYRINTFTITIPPLRERREEIPFLIKEMVSRCTLDLDRSFVFADWLIEAAQEYHWPGNLRELKNFVIRTLVLKDQATALQDLRRKTLALSGGMKLKSQPTWPVEFIASDPAGMKGAISEVKNRTEVRLLNDALIASGWNRRKAATTLNISYRSLLYKIQQHGLTL